MAINKIAGKPAKNHAGLRNVIEYVLKENKTASSLIEIIGPYDKDIISWDNVYNSFLEEKRLWNKDSGRMYSHNIISFHKDENITAQQALDFAKEFTEEWYRGYQALIAIHTDKEHIHAHIVVNSVSYIDGHKLHSTKSDLENMKQFTNDMCRIRGLSVAEKGKDFYGNKKEEQDISIWNKNLYQLINNDSKKSYKADCASNVIKISYTACSQEEFIQLMKESGWTVEWTNRKHIVFKNEDNKKIRDSNLSKTFQIDINKESLLKKFEENKTKQLKNEQHKRHVHSHHRKH